MASTPGSNKLDDEQIKKTARQAQARITGQFPDSGLGQIALGIVSLTESAITEATKIRQPNLWLRGGLIAVALLAVIGFILYFFTDRDQQSTADRIFHFLDVTKGAAVYLTGVAVFLFTLEVRFKRRKAMRAIHTLRAVAHVIDMHQLNKTPDRIGLPDGPKMEDGTLMSAEQVGLYLNHCTVLLSIVSKLGQLYVQDFPDSAAQNAVDQFENLATGLSSKIWQKIMILDRFRSSTPRTDA